MFETKKSNSDKTSIILMNSQIRMKNFMNRIGNMRRTKP